MDNALEALVDAVQAQTAEIGELRSVVRQQDERIDQMTGQFRCLHKGVTKFCNDYEPFLKDAIDERNRWKDRRESIVTKVLTTTVVGAVVFTGYAVWDSVVHKLHELVK